MVSESIRSKSRDFSLDGWRLDSLVTVLSILVMVGIGLDAQGHAAGNLSFAEEGFLTPEHVFFYTAFLGVAAVLGVKTWHNRSAGADWVAAVPDGYGIGVLGVLLFGFGGVGDFFWHSAFGFEQGTEALTSPSHLSIATGGVLFLSSPLRSVWRRSGPASNAGMLSGLVSAMLAFSLFGLFASLLNPIATGTIFSPYEASMQIGISGFTIFPAVLVGVGLLLAFRFELPPGALTFVFLGPAVMGVAVRPEHAPLVGSAVVAGVVADLLVAFYPPRATHAPSLRLFGGLVPLAFGASYVALARYAFAEPIAWSVHIWTGAVTFGALGGLVMTYVSVPDTTREVRG